MSLKVSLYWESSSYVSPLRMLFFYVVCMHGCIVITYRKGKDQPGKVTNPGRGQPNREN